MAKFTKLPITIEAVQFWAMGDHPAVVYSQEGRHFFIRTLEGDHVVTPGDWIITGVKGERYPCKPDIFAATYVPADEDRDQRRRERNERIWQAACASLTGRWAGSPVDAFPGHIACRAFDDAEAFVFEYEARVREIPE